MIEIAICDDNLEEANILEALLSRYAEEKNYNFHITTYTNGFLFLDALEKNFHICFLDIFMPAFSGIDTAKELRTIDKDMHLVFCTSSKDFALDGYTLQASNYLIKPVEPNTLFVAVDEIMRRIHKEKKQKFSILTVDGLQLISTDTISHVIPDGNYCKIILQDNSIISCRLSFIQMTENLSKNHNFAVINRSALLNYDVVVGMENGKFILTSGVKIPIPRRKKKEITQNFLDYSMEK
ncbi:MAG: LytTR family DNA-binding domain-containing protein [Eubacteriales bacterium]